MLARFRVRCPLTGHADPGQTTGTIPTRDEFSRPLQLVRLAGNPLYHPAKVRRPVLAAETGRAGPARPEKVPGWPDRRITGQTAAVCGDVISATGSARLRFLPGSIPPGGGDGGREGEDQDAGTGDTLNKRGGHGGVL